MFNQKFVLGVLGCNVELVKKMYFILVAISCQQKLDVEKFKALCIETAYLWVEQFPFYYMPTTLHKLLIHGNDKFLYFYFTQMSEENTLGFDLHCFIS